MNENDKHWYVIYTSPNCEKKLLVSIKKINLVAYLPINEEIRQWSDRRKKITMPLFKSYLFVYLDYSGIHTVKVLPGFVDFIRFGGLPTIIPSKEITLIKSIMTMNKYVETTSRRLIKGDRVKLLKGSLAGYEGTLCEGHYRGKVAVEINKLDMSLVLDVPVEQMEKINIV
ncbi:MAG: UpxY family transcription antiterminator [Colwellia sp.]|nr:UpxY family transcription antiterminator [Colwellia sp.]